MPTTSWGLTFDCENAPAMARFWTMALGYVDKPPPEGWDTWEDWLRHFEVPDDDPAADGRRLLARRSTRPRSGEHEQRTQPDWPPTQAVT